MKWGAGEGGVELLTTFLLKQDSFSGVEGGGGNAVIREIWLEATAPSSASRIRETRETPPCFPWGHTQETLKTIRTFLFA